MASRPAQQRGLTPEAWNALYPVGTAVRYRHTKYDPWIDTTTRSVAWMLCGTPVVMVEGIAGGVAIGEEWMEVVGGH